MTSTVENRPDRRHARLLLIEDSPSDARRIQAHFEETDFSCELEHADSLERVLCDLSDDHFDLCLLDLGLDDGVDPESLDRFQEWNGELPLVVMTGLDDLDGAAAALRAGAEQYLLRDEITPEILTQTLRVVLERDRARRERRKVEEKWSTVFESSPVAIVLSDADSGRLVEVNDAFVEMFGWSREELLGESSLELGQWDDPHRRRELVERVKEHGHFEGEEATFRNAEGRPGRMLLACRRLDLADGDRLLWTVQDITDQVERERALAERVKEQSCLYDVSRILHEGEGPLGVQLQEVVDRIPAGWQYPEAAAAKIRVEGHPPYLSEGFEDVDQRLEADLEVEGERVGELVVGYREERPEADLGPFLVEERELLQELAERIAVELSRQKTRREMVQVVETMNEGVVIVTPEGRITFGNSAACRLFDVRDKGCTGQNLTDFASQVKTLGGEPFPPAALPFQRVLQTGRPVTGLEHLIEHTDGTRVVVSVNAAPMEGEDGEIRGVVLTIRDVTDRHRMEEELRHRTLHDALTGLPNRTLFWDRLEHALQRSRRTGERLAVFFFDLDGFKRINDEHGHAAGDEVLREVADRLRFAVTEADTLARLGGDEFGVLLEDLEDVSEADEMAGRLTERFGRPVSVAGEDALLRVSCGIALAGGEDRPGLVTADDLVRRADRAMYAAKEEPGSTSRRFGPEIADQRTGRLKREIELKEALDAGDVVPHYQPLVDLEDGRIVGAEALARWDHPERGLVSPGTFIPLAEETGLIVELGRQVVRAACEQLAAWREDGLVPPGFRLHVNLSARELDRPDVVDVLEGMLGEVGLAPEHVAFEVTESVAIESSRVLERIRALGSPVAVDDFGTGYATLERLASLDLDSLKLDRLFVDRIGSSHRHEAVLEASLTLADSMELCPVAEGVETEEQREWLLKHGCRFAQGFLFARAVPPGELAGWLRSSLHLPAHPQTRGLFVT